MVSEQAANNKQSGFWTSLNPEPRSLQTQCIVDLFGVRAPRRASVYFDTKNRRWGEIMGAFGAVKVSDGEITLVLERKLERRQASP